jgi:hypothetical protein
MKVLGWRVWYNNGTTFSNEDGLPEEAPLDGIQIIVEWLDNGQRHYHYGRDFYIWTGDRWNHGYQREFDTWVRNLLKQIKYGYCTSDENYEKIIKEAKSWPSQ